MTINEKYLDNFNAYELYTFGTENKPYEDKHHNAVLVFKDKTSAEEYVRDYGMGEQEFYKVKISNPIKLFSLHKKNDYTKLHRYARVSKGTNQKKFLLDSGYDGYIGGEVLGRKFEEMTTNDIIKDLKFVAVYKNELIKIVQ